MPALIGYFQKKADYAHETEVLKLQMENQKIIGQQKLEEIAAQIDVTQMENIYKPQTIIGSWIDSLVGSVRPVITYSFFILYAGVKLANFFVIMKTGQDMGWSESLQLIWHDEDMGIFATILAYWFGTRAMHKYSGGK